MRIKWFSVIRIIGLFLVLGYHFFIKLFPGGFVGVDLFFTLSGYLTTALFIDEWAKGQRIDLIGFFKRRFYRLFPLLVVTILLVLPLALLVRNDFMAGIGKQVIAALGFMTNFFEILSGGSYENQFSPHLFVHTWTLALEVHFYVIWALWIWNIGRQSKSLSQLRGLIFLTSGLGFLLSFLSMFLTSFFVSNYSIIYYSSWTHIFPFFVGSLLATFIGINQTTPLFQRLVKQTSLLQIFLLFGVGLSLQLLLLFFLNFNSIWPYIVGLLTSSLATAVMIVSMRLLHEKTPRLTEPAPLNYLANISYGIYLLHWPLYLIFSQLLGQGGAISLTLIFSLILSTLSFYLLEPFVAGKKGKLLGLEIDLTPYKSHLLVTLAFFTLLGVGISLTAPTLGNFERESMLSNLYQAQTQLATTRAGVEKAQATGYEIQKGVTILGDSVTVRASTAIQQLLPDVQIDGVVSRHLTELEELMTLYKKNGNLRETVVVALGTNTSENYQELLDQLIAQFPKGHRLVFVTPYDGNYTPNNSLAYKTGQYEKELAKKENYITIADWYKVSKENPKIWLNTDHVHFSLEADGDKLFAQTIQKALKKAEDSPIRE